MEMGTLWVAMATLGVILGVNSGHPHRPRLLRHPIIMGQFRARAQSRAWRARLPLYPLRKRVSLLVSMPSAVDFNEELENLKNAKRTTVYHQCTFQRKT